MASAAVVAGPTVTDGSHRHGTRGILRLARQLAEYANPLDQAKIFGFATGDFDRPLEASIGGLVSDWRPVFTELRSSPWGKVARRVEQYLSYREPVGVSALFTLAIERARTDAESADRAEVATRVRTAVSGSRLTNSEFARLVGTSASRLNTYLSGKVIPSAAMLVRMERAARNMQHGPS